MQKYDSDEELYFTWYLDELKEYSVIIGYDYHPKPFELSPKVYHTYQKKMKIKSKLVNAFLLASHSYQADFIIRWNPDYITKIFCDISQLSPLNTPFIANRPQNSHYPYSVIDVKGIFSFNDTYRRFSIEQKWVYQKYRIYVQKIIPEKLFRETFTPEKYKYTNRTEKPRKLKYTPVSIKEYLK